METIFLFVIVIIGCMIISDELNFSFNNSSDVFYKKEYNDKGVLISKTYSDSRFIDLIREGAFKYNQYTGSLEEFYHINIETFDGFSDSFVRVLFHKNGKIKSFRKKITKTFSSYFEFNESGELIEQRINGDITNFDNEHINELWLSNFEEKEQTKINKLLELEKKIKSNGNK